MKTFLLVGSSLLATITAQAAMAQDAPPPNAVTSQTQPPAPTPVAVSDSSSSGTAADIVVTAQRRTQRLQDVPVAVSVVNGDALTRASITNVSDLSQRLPNVKITAGGNSDFINIRGVGSGQNPGFEQSVATFVDGAYRGRSRASRAALFDVDRVEVLKGPQTTFFGNNAIAGALNITTRKPGTDLDYNLTGSAGSYGEFLLEGGVSAPITDTLSVRVAGRYSGMNGYVHNDFLNQDGPHLRDYIGRVAVAFRPTENFRSDLRVDRGRTRGTNTYSAEFINCPAGSCNPSLAAIYGPSFDDKLDGHSDGPESYTRYDFTEAAWTNSLDLGGVTLSAITGYFHHNFEQLEQQIPVPLRGVGGGGLLPVWVGEKYRSFSQEVRLQSETGGFFEWMVGAYYLHGKLDNTLYSGFRFPVQTPGGTLFFGDFLPGVYTAASPIAVRLRVHEKEETKSGFASATIRPVDRLRVNLGLRYSVVNKTAHRLIDFGASGADPSVGYVQGPSIATTVYAPITGAVLGDFTNTSRTDRKLMPSAGIQYDFTHDVMGYASYTKGFKAGGFGQSARADEFGPENVDAYEIGLKSTLFDRHVTANIDAFWSDYSDLQESSTIFVNGISQTVVNNAAKARSRGIEGSLSWTVNRNLSFNTDVAYLDAKYRSYPNASCTIAENLVTRPCVQDLSGRRRAYSPKFSGNIGASVRVPVDNVELRFDPLVYFTSAFFETPTADPILRQKGNTKFDMRVAIGPSDHRWELAVVGKNLTDKITAGFRNSASLPGSAYALTDPRRSVLVQFSIKR